MKSREKGAKTSANVAGGKCASRSSSPATVVFCRELRRLVSLGVTVWRQRAEIARASDAAVRLRIEGAELEVTDADVDCEDDPRRPRRRAPADTATAAAERLLTEIFGR